VKKQNYSKFITLFLLVIIFAFVSSPETSAQSKRDRERAQRAAKQGDEFFNRKDYRNAITKYAQAITLVPNFPAAYFWKAYAHFYLGEYEQALRDFDSAMSLGYDKPLEIYRVRWLLHYEKGNYDAALNDALAGLRLDPNNATLNLAVGDIYRIRKNYREAITYLKKGIQLAPNNGDGHYFLAECYFNLGEYLNQGFAALDALKSNTKYLGESYYLAADALYKARKYDEAIFYYEKAISTKPEIYGSYSALSDIYRIKNRFNDAIAVAQKGLELFPQDAGLYISLSWYYSLADRHQEAILAAQSAIRLDPNQPMGYTNLCRALNDTKQYNQAIQACTSALRLNPGDGESHLYIARAYEFLKQPAKATENYEKAIQGLLKFTRENPEYSDGFYLLGNAYFALARDEEAAAAYKRCLELAPNFARARFTLGMTYLEMGKKSLAREQYDYLRRLDSNLAERLRIAIESKR
jgi:tetratricopeptide (TPR) repeat protein